MSSTSIGSEARRGDEGCPPVVLRKPGPITTGRCCRKGQRPPLCHFHRFRGMGPAFARTTAAFFWRRPRLLATAPFLNETLIDDAIAALAAYRIFARGINRRSTRSAPSRRLDLAAARVARGWFKRSVTDAEARRSHFHHPRAQRRPCLSVADPARALDGRLRLRHLCLCLDLGAAARQHDGFRHLRRCPENHPGIPHKRRRCTPARVSL